MFRWASHFLIFLIGAPVLLSVATRYIPGISFTGDWVLLVKLGGLIGIINFFVLPVLRFFLKPFILFSLGLASVLLNMAAIVVAVRLAPGITIAGWLPLFWLSLWFGAFNTALAFVLRK